MEKKKLLPWLAISALAVVVVAVLLLPSSEEQRQNVTSVSTASDRAELEAVLGEMKRTWQPNAKRKLLRKAAGKIERLEAPLLDLLAESHPLRTEAIQLAADLKVTRSRGAIARLATQGPEQLRPPAILAVERLDPWSQLELLGFLEDKPAVVRAALKLCASRDDRPLAEILRLLSHDDADVREAAIQAIPNEMDSHDVRELVAVARSATDAQALHFIRALGRTKRSSEVE